MKKGILQGASVQNAELNLTSEKNIFFLLKGK